LPSQQTIQVLVKGTDLEVGKLKGILEPLERMAKHPLIVTALEFDPILLSMTTESHLKPLVLVPPVIMIFIHLVKPIFNKCCKSHV